MAPSLSWDEGPAIQDANPKAREGRAPKAWGERIQFLLPAGPCVAYRLVSHQALHTALKTVSSHSEDMERRSLAKEEGGGWGWGDRKRQEAQNQSPRKGRGTEGMDGRGVQGVLRRAAWPRQGFREGQGESQAQRPYRPPSPSSSVPLRVLFPHVHTSCPTNSFYSNSPFETQLQAFTGCTVDKNLPDNAGGTGRFPVQEDTTCCGVTKPTCHNY